MLLSSGMLGVSLPCTYVSYGPSDIMNNNWHIGYILGMLDYTLLATTEAP